MSTWAVIIVVCSCCTLIARGLPTYKETKLIQYLKADDSTNLNEAKMNKVDGNIEHLIDRLLAYQKNSIERSSAERSSERSKRQSGNILVSCTTQKCVDMMKEFLKQQKEQNGQQVILGGRWG